MHWVDYKIGVLERVLIYVNDSGSLPTRQGHPDIPGLGNEEAVFQEAAAAVRLRRKYPRRSPLS